MPKVIISPMQSGYKEILNTTGKQMFNSIVQELNSADNINEFLDALPDVYKEDFTGGESKEQVFDKLLSLVDFSESGNTNYDEFRKSFSKPSIEPDATDSSDAKRDKKPEPKSIDAKDMDAAKKKSIPKTVKPKNSGDPSKIKHIRNARNAITDDLKRKALALVVSEVQKSAEPVLVDDLKYLLIKKYPDKFKDYSAYRLITDYAQGKIKIDGLMGLLPTVHERKRAYLPADLASRKQ